MTHGIFLYESTLHVPLLIAGPGVPQSTVVSEQVRSIDVMPTIIEFLRLAPGDQVQEVSLWPLMTQGQKVRSNYAYLETIYPRTYMGWSELRGMRADTWKFILAPQPELYNLADDPGETNNLFEHHPAEAGQLQAKMWEITGRTSPQEKVVPAALDEQTRQELQSLGYVSAGTPDQIELGTSAPDPKLQVDVLKALDDVATLLGRKEYAEAARRMEQGLKRDPGNPLGHIYLGVALDKMGDVRREVEVYRNALDRGIDTDEIESRLGKAYLRLHDVGKAAEAMARAVALNPRDLDTLRNLGTAYLELHRVDDAERAFKGILIQNEGYGAAYNGLGLAALQRRDGDGARRYFEKALDVAPTEAEPMLNLGLLYQRAGDKKQAIR